MSPAFIPVIMRCLFLTPSCITTVGATCFTNAGTVFTVASLSPSSVVNTQMTLNKYLTSD